MQLTLTSHVLPMVWVEPNRVLFQDIFKGTGARQEVTITARKPGFEISSIEGRGAVHQRQDPQDRAG